MPTVEKVPAPLPVDPRPPRSRWVLGVLMVPNSGCPKVGCVVPVGRPKT